ncbi:hydrogen gas-evolving membrane-bound hydrogenase subunit E [uncultured Chloroflexus sp.]|uniref:hydrogen gas-evolving membrane-bound hydrogenase subunit E n=1 Tax=uncultured Chloroflexus sp. TaxID=214040 RepID=UPI0026211D02|nr:hydrogen gas-evolving membrane-bound hydrogenase subunit E [uncultured Chloroflexus sp.]
MLYPLVLIALAAAPFALVARFAGRDRIAWGLALIPLAIFGLTLAQAGSVWEGGQVVERIAWVPALGLDLSFTLDGLSLLFALIITGIGTLIVGYAGHYLATDNGLGRFLAYMMLFMGAMLGLVLAGNVLTMFVFWELTSVTSYLLIGYKHDYADARRGALHSLLVTAGGGLALLVGLLLLGQAAGSYELSDILAAGDVLRAHALYPAAVVLILLGCFTKSAQIPFHFWLPGAMQAPTPASAFLHSATMVKAGVYLMARLSPALGGTALWDVTLAVVGGATMTFAAIVAMRQFDLKAMLAYTTISMLGALTMQIGLGGKYGAEGVATNILAHALYKSALFMLAGVIDHECGTRDLRRLGGLRAYMPRTMVITALALLSFGGIPVMFGFVAKELMLEAALETELGAMLSTLAVAAIAVTAGAYLITGWRLFSNTFLGQRSVAAMQQHITDPTPGMLIGPGVPAVLSLIIPLAFLGPISSLIGPASAAIYGKPLEVKLALWHGVNTALLVSLGAIAAGAVLARFGEQLANLRGWPAWMRGDMIFDRLIERTLTGATTLTRTIQEGRLRRYILLTALALLVFVGVPFVGFGISSIRFDLDPQLQFYEILAAALIPVGVIATINARTRLGAIIAVSVVGAMVALLFVLFSAPDLSLTQLLIEVLSTVFLLLVFSVLPVRFENFSAAWVRRRDAIIATAMGFLMGGLVLATATNDAFAPLAPFFLENSLEKGKGANVVNVILVDFRGFDTLGEITVLFIALLGIYGLLRLRQGKDNVAPERVTTTEPAAEPVDTKR